MAIHYLGDIQHVTCQTENGRRRSSLSDISYNSGQELMDQFTGRPHHRQHTDGTVIIATDVVSADARCPYGDSSVPSARRRERMYHELYMLNKVNSERIYWKTVVALPEQFDDGQLTETAHKIALSFSNYLGRPVDYSVHRKPAGKNKDKCHIHFAVPERKYTAGKWSQKSTSYYINKDGTVNYEKRYKDEKGNDVREPRTKNGEKPVYATDEKDGHEYCVNQVRDSNGRRKWKLTNIESVTPDDLAWMHEEIDRIQNEALKKYGIDDKVKRNDKRTTRELKEAGVKAVHIGKRDNEAKGKNLREKIERNERYKKIANAFNEGYKKLDESEKQLADIEKITQKEEKEIAMLNRNIAKADSELQQERAAAERAIVSYVENELRPEETYINMATAEYEKAAALADKNLAMLKDIANNKIHAIDKVLNASINNTNRTEKETLATRFIVANRKHWCTYHNATLKQGRPAADDMKAAARKRWRRCSGWQRCEFIKTIAGETPAFLYRQYLKMKGESVEKTKENNALKIVTCEEAIADTIASIPGLDAKADKAKSAAAFAAAFTAEIRNDETELFLPPGDSDAAALWSTVPNRMLSMTAGTRGAVINPLPGYSPDKDKAVFEADMKLLLDKEASQTNAGNTKHVGTKETDEQVFQTDAAKPETREEEIKRHREDYDRSTKLRQEALDMLRSKTAMAYAEIMYKKEEEIYAGYLRDREHLDLCEENLMETKKETPNDYAEISRLQQRYDTELKKLKKLYPDHPLREPDILVNRKEADALFKNYRADLVKKKIAEQSLPVPKELIDDYDRKAEESQRLWKLVQADEAQDKPQGEGKTTGKDKPKTKTRAKTTAEGKGKPDDENTL